MKKHNGFAFDMNLRLMIEIDLAELFLNLEEFDNLNFLMSVDSPDKGLHNANIHLPRTHEDALWLSKPTLNLSYDLSVTPARLSYSFFIGSKLQRSVESQLDYIKNNPAFDEIDPMLLSRQTSQKGPFYLIKDCQKIAGLAYKNLKEKSLEPENLKLKHNFEGVNSGSAIYRTNQPLEKMLISENPVVFEDFKNIYDFISERSKSTKSFYKND